MSTQAPLFRSYHEKHDASALPLREQPAQRVLADSRACNNVELLAALIGGPHQIETATALLAKFDSVFGIVSASVADIASVRGIGNTTAARLKAALELGLRAMHAQPERVQINSPADAANVLRPCFLGQEQEHVYVLMLDTRNRVIGQPVLVYKGSLNMSMIRVGELFREAIRWNAASIIMAHSHPSGDPSPSPDDVAVTRMVVEAGKLLDIAAHDHLIIGSGTRFVSLKERGLGFS
ncbi:DNA repair protein RadC [Candidatus Kaiserbacteria bacterium]|nr:DNA repair protein RadC [Candidatus Kaiserbacteria bacterium]